MISEQDIAFYREHGYLVVPDVLSAAEVAELRRVTEEFVENARARTTHDEVYDLEDSHSAAEPRVRRIKTPHQWHESYARVGRASEHPGGAQAALGARDPLRRQQAQPQGRGLRRAGRVASGLGVLPAHQRRSGGGRHHARRRRRDQRPADGDPGQPHGADPRPPRRSGLLLRRDRPGARRARFRPRRSSSPARPARSRSTTRARSTARRPTPRAGRGACCCTSTAPPTPGRSSACRTMPPGATMLLCGEECEPRLAPAPVRLPLPPAAHQGSIYENQRTRKSRFFQTADELVGGRLSAASEPRSSSRAGRFATLPGAVDGSATQRAVR